MDIIIKKKKNIFLDFKKNIIIGDIDSIQDELINDSSLNLSRTKLKRDKTNYNISLMNFENSFFCFFTN